MSQEEQRSAASFDLNQIDQQQATESAQVIQLALDLRRLGTDEDVAWAQELTKRMPQMGDTGVGWWIQQVKERMRWT